MERRRDEAEVPAWATFVADTRRAAQVWAKWPGLPVFVFAVHLALGLVVIAPLLSLLAFPVFVFLVGFVGSERLWYLHAFSGWSSLSAGDLWNAAWGYFGRFFVLGLTLAPIFVVSGFLTVLTSPAVGITINALIYIGVDLVLTFVTPALAFTDHRVTAAWSRGWRFLRTHWGRAKWHVLIPPFAVQMVAGGFNQSADSLQAAWLVGTVAVVLGLLFKGAQAAYFLRHEPVDPDALPLVRTGT